MTDTEPNGVEMGLQQIMLVFICMLLVTTAVLSVTSSLPILTHVSSTHPSTRKSANLASDFGDIVAKALNLIAVVLVVTMLLVVLLKFLYYTSSTAELCELPL